MKQMRILTVKNLREMAKTVNLFNDETPDNPIQREDIVSIIKGDGQYFLVFFN